jgi:aromatic ring-opening dioxygenase catalytic subunit (LigB family)
VGRALEPLRDEGFAIVGCGALTRDAPREASRARARGGVTGTFDEWVVDLLTRTGPYARSRGLARFRDHPEAHRAQPRGEHVLPLVVVAGAATSDRSADNVGELSHSTAATVAADGRPIGGALGLVFRR